MKTKSSKSKIEKKVTKLRVIFMGTSMFSKEILSALIGKNYNIVAVFTQPDKKAGRKSKVKISPVKEFCKKNKLQFFQPSRLDVKITEQIKNMRPDFIIVVAYGRILPGKILEIPGFGSINVHASLLPKYRGPSPIQNAIINGEKKTGITIMLMDKNIDTGAILSQEEVEINPADTTEMLSKKLMGVGAKLLLKTIPQWVERKIDPKKQNNSEAVQCQLIEREDGRVFWNEKASDIYNSFRAFYSWPGIFSSWKKDGITHRIKLNEVEILRGNKGTHKNGMVFKEGNKIAIQASVDAILLKEVQLEGKKPLPINDFINGHHDFIGSVLK